MSPEMQKALRATGMLSKDDWEEGAYIPWYRRQIHLILLRMAGLAFCLFVLKLISSGWPENLLQWVLLPAGGVALFFLVELALWSDFKYGDPKKKSLEESESKSSLE